MRIALAFSYTRQSEHNKAMKILEGLRTDQTQGKGISDVEKVNVLRLLAVCTASDTKSVADVEEIYKDALEHIRTVRSHKVNGGMKQMRCRVLFEYALFLANTGDHTTKALDLLNQALHDMILMAATHSKCGNLKVLENFQSAGQREKLDYIGSGTRELAHCVYAIGKLLRETEPSLSKEYHEKAHKLGIQFVLEAGKDSYTHVIFLHEIGTA